MKRALFCIVLLLICLSVLPMETRAADAENLVFVANSNASYCLVRCDVSATGELEIPATHNGYPVTQIGDFAFSECTGLTAITIPEGIKTIGLGAFSGCTNLTRISIPDSVTAVGIYAFDGCTSLTYHTYGNAKYLGNESNPYALLTDAVSADITSCQIHTDTRSIGYEAFSGCVKLTEITVPDKVAAIGSYAFDGCAGLGHVSLGEGLADIGESAFRGCAGLTEILFPDGITAIGDSAFQGCAGLTEITLPGGIASIGWYAFAGCSGLREITLPGSLTAIGKYAFEGCAGLEKVVFDGDCVAWNALIGHGTAGISDSATILNGGHCYDWVKTEEATCISEGTMTYMCIGCGDNEGETKPISLTDHSYGLWTEVKAPTTEEAGTEERKCIYCDEKEERKIAKLTVTPTEPSTEPSTEPAPTVPTEEEKDSSIGSWIAGIGIGALLAVGTIVVYKKRNRK